ncbi:ADP-ribosylglycohydrolase family protein [Sinomonas sp. P10A9]|uniref:ADP-ribosylglycohydrolase family protein n=1 Tax=Sinomonas puerhi TaxID=3238584 RepID=A0AB39L0V6_9MICC
MTSPTPASRIQGCLVGTAVAEAAAIAGLSADASGEVWGPGEALAGDAALRPLGAAGQLTLFTADGLAEVIEWANDGVHADEAAGVWLASLRWVAAQGVPLSPSAPMAQPRWLDAQDGVLVPAAVRPVWLGSLASGEMGLPGRPSGSDCDDAGAAAHAAAFGLIAHVSAATVAKMAFDGAALTHSAPVALQAAAAVACMTHFLTLGADYRTAAGSAYAQIASLRSPHDAVLAALDAAGEAGSASTGSSVGGDAPGSAGGTAGARVEGRADAAAILAGAVASVLAAESAHASGDPRQHAFAAGIRLAAAHGSDAAAIAGALLGTGWGYEAVPTEWITRTAGMIAAEGVAVHFADVTGA